MAEKTKTPSGHSQPPASVAPATAKPQAPAVLNDGDDLRGKLLKRLGVAGGLVVVLLSVLAFFDYLSAPEEEEAPVYTKPVPVAPKKEVIQAVKPADLPEPPKADEKVDDKAGAPINPVQHANIPAEPPAKADKPEKPEVAAQPAVPAGRNEPRVTVRPEAPVQRPLLPTAPPRPADLEAPRAPQPPSPPARPVMRPVAPAAPVAPIAEGTSAPRTTIPEEAALAPAPSRPAETLRPQAVPASPPLLPRLFSGFVLQAGVFANAQRAEELHAKLTLNGIPSTLEARVQVGPFKTREEADAAKAKLQALGIDAVMLPPRNPGRR